MARKILKRTFYVLASLVAIYSVTVLLGLLPVNNDFVPADDGIEIWVVSNSIHSDFVVPIQTEEINWRDFLSVNNLPAETSKATHCAIGWGDLGFFVNTPTWDDLTLATASNALLWPSRSCLHVDLTNIEEFEGAVSVRISSQQYRELVSYIQKSFRKTNGKLAIIDGAGYGDSDMFFEANGSYHMFQTCNCWIGNGLKAAGVRTGWFTPLPKTVFLHLPKQSDTSSRE